jgi:mono/diheme cytochrome c family protein
VPADLALLSGTGLYADLPGDVLADDVIEYQPEFALWSDGAVKRRFAIIPEGTTIDTSDPDAWVYPVGMRVFKEFTRDGVRVETRMLQKRGPGDWLMVAYLWAEDGSEAMALEGEVRDALGTMHDVPDREGCDNCHGDAPDVLLGFTAIQLDHDLGGANVSSLAADGWLSDPPAVSLDIPGDETTRAALGYLHANCGNCHRDGSDNPLRLWLETDGLDAPESTATYATSIGVPSMTDDPLADTDATQIVAPGDPSSSLLHIRMLRRGRSPGGGMPWLGTEIVDDEGAAAVAAWISSLTP